MVLEGRHVAVVGAGIGGTAAALLLARAGAHVTLFEQAPEPRAAGAGILLQPNGLAVLYGLDLDERLARRGIRVTRLRVADAGGTPIFDVPIPRFADGLDHALVLPRGEVLAALVDLVVAEPAIECRFGTEVDAVGSDGTVTYRAPDGPRSVAADLVVGADGVHSRVRKQSRCRAHVSQGFRYVRGLGPPMPLDAMTEYWTGLGIFGLAPIDRGTYFYASTHADPLPTAVANRDLELFRSAWAGALPAAGAALAGVRRFDDLLVNEVRRIDCASWTDGAIVLLGDAAHAMAPNLAQGAGSALVDAVVLAWELAQPGDRAAALVRYDARRRPAVRAVQDLTDRLASLADLTHPVLRWLRDGGVRLFGSWVAGEVPLRLVEQEDPLWLRLAATDPIGAADERTLRE